MYFSVNTSVQGNMFEKLSYYMDNGFKVVMHKDITEKIITVKRDGFATSEQSKLL